MKKNILIAVLMIVFGGCDDASSRPNEGSSQEIMLSSSSKIDDAEKSSSSIKEFNKISEFIMNRDCSSGTEIAGIEFDSDSVRCGEKGPIHFGLDPIDNSKVFSPLGFYLFYDSDAYTTKDSLWILETDPIKYAGCEKLEISDTNLPGAFCLKKFDVSVKREPVSNYVDYENRINYGKYFVYSKPNSYKTFCNVVSIDCYLFCSCVVLYDGTFNFSRVPSADNVERKKIGCVE
ncbi:hypothetical protein [Fibrobacter succinogenes]|uniref:hypothetical protein n=1 Tax=Fibrobacter succinogenes TaxID=833 RepID=UPI0015690535|nr:hypothetical protein [Fibrobacter succinogenes]